MAWSIAEVARMSGVTSRTLRHYDAIGLLPRPTCMRTATATTRPVSCCGSSRSCCCANWAVGLGDIAAAVGPGPDTVTALRRHHTRLLAEAERLTRLAGTVARTVAHLEGDPAMTHAPISHPENLFEGFSPADHEDEARERWPGHFGPAQQAAQAMGPEQVEAGQKQLTAQMIRMSGLMTAGRLPGDPEVQAEVERHYRWVARHWTPSAQAYRNLGQLYTGDERFRVSYERVTPGLAGYQRDAMDVYAQEHLV